MGALDYCNDSLALILKACTFSLYGAQNSTDLKNEPDRFSDEPCRDVARIFPEVCTIFQIPLPNTHFFFLPAIIKFLYRQDGEVNAVSVSVI